MRRRTRFLLAIGIATVAIPAAPAVPGAQEVGWRPVASERLIKLPAAYLQKAIDEDFARSELGMALARNKEAADLKAATLEDLARAQEVAEGEPRLDLRQQLLGEKRSFIRIMGERQALERKRATARLRLLRTLVARIDRTADADIAAARAVRASYARARERFDAALVKVDDALLSSDIASDSRYAADYARNVAMIERLRRAVAAHPMNRPSDPALEGLSKRELLERMAMDAEADLAVLRQEEKVLGFMAKLVALDAMALADALRTVEREAEAEAGRVPPTLAAAVQFFIGTQGAEQ